MTSSLTALQKAVQLLARRDYSTLELRRKLSSRYPAAEVHQALEKLRQKGLLDEERLALERARVRRESQLWGDSKLRADLAAIGISDKISERALGVVNGILGEAESLDLLTDKWIAIHGKPASRRQMKRFFDYCLRRGYPPDLVRSKLEIWWNEADAG